MIDVCLQHLLVYNCIFQLPLLPLKVGVATFFRFVVPNIKLVLPNFDAVVVAAMSDQCNVMVAAEITSPFTSSDFSTSMRACPPAAMGFYIYMKLRYPQN